MLLLVLVGCVWVACSPVQAAQLPNIEMGWPLPDDLTQQSVGTPEAVWGPGIVQMPACHALGGVCSLNADCNTEAAAEATDLCGNQTSTVCCITHTANEKKIVQMKSCVQTGSLCAWVEDCPEEDRQDNPLLCGDQDEVTCCRTGMVSPRDGTNRRRPHVVQLESCFSEGGLCRQEENCPQEDRLGSSDMCGDQPYITCCKATTDIVHVRPPLFNSPAPPAHGPRNKRVFNQQTQCLLKGGMCQATSDCPEQSRYPTPGLCGTQNDVSCCKILPPRTTSCGSRGGECVSKGQCGRAPTESLGSCPQATVCCIWTRNTIP